MIGRFGLRNKAVDKCDRFGKAAERELLANGIAIDKRPSPMAFEALLGFTA